MVRIDEAKPIICVSARTAYRTLEKSQKNLKVGGLNKTLSGQNRKKKRTKNGSFTGRSEQLRKKKTSYQKANNFQTSVGLTSTGSRDIAKHVTRPVKKDRKLIENGSGLENFKKTKKLIRDSIQMKNANKRCSLWKNLKEKGDNEIPELKSNKYSSIGISMRSTGTSEGSEFGTFPLETPVQVPVAEINSQNMKIEQVRRSTEKTNTGNISKIKTTAGKNMKKRGSRPTAKFSVTERLNTDHSVSPNSKKGRSGKRELDLSSFSLDAFISAKYKKHRSNNRMNGEDSQTIGLATFKKIIEPVNSTDFFKQYWEKSHLMIRATDKEKFRGLLSTSDLDTILRTNKVMYTKNIDVTSYKDGVRETHNPEGRALPGSVWGFYNNGCSVRMLNPQTFHRPVWKLLSTLQEYFNSFCGANVYLTPPGTQGFAPHWDDIEAFILQLEGKKRWRVYGPRNLNEKLPRYSSGNFGPEDRLGPALLDCILEPGDVLYFPRGFIHQGEALPDAHSLHITISSYQKNSWVDLLEKLLPAALATASEEDVEFRAGLPLDYLQCAGVALSEVKMHRKKALTEKVTQLVHRMMEYAPIDATVDQMAKGFIHDALPPVLTSEEEKRTVFKGGAKWCPGTNGIKCGIELSPESSVRLIRRGCARIVVEENSVRLFHTLENSREYHEEEPQYIEIFPEVAPAVEFLIVSYPKYTPIKSLPLSAAEDKMAVAVGLWEKGIIEVL